MKVCKFFDKNTRRFMNLTTYDFWVNKKKNQTYVSLLKKKIHHRSFSSFSEKKKKHSQTFMIYTSFTSVFPPLHFPLWATMTKFVEKLAVSFFLRLVKNCHVHVVNPEGIFYPMERIKEVYLRSSLAWIFKRLRLFSAVVDNEYVSQRRGI